MINIEAPNIDDIARILVLERADSGSYHCPRIEKHKGSLKNGGLEINNDGSFKCTCGISGPSFVSLVSILYDIPDRDAERWIEKRMEEVSDGID